MTSKHVKDSLYPDIDEGTTNQYDYLAISQCINIERSYQCDCNDGYLYFQVWS